MPRIGVLAAVAGFAGAAMDAGAQVYPARPITVVVPFPAGRGTNGPCP